MNQIIDRTLLKGHRKRLKDKFLKSENRSFDDYEILEMILYSCYARCDTKKYAKELIKKAGSLQAVFSIDHMRLKDLGFNNNVIFQFKLLIDLFSRLNLDVKQRSNVLSNWNAVLNYCNITMGFQMNESFRVLFLNKKNVLINDQVMQIGTIDRVIVYPREIAKNCLIHSAAAVILVHNHPSGDITPSNEDIEVTNKIVRALEPLGISVHDHLIVSQNKTFSFKNTGLL